MNTPRNLASCWVEGSRSKSGTTGLISNSGRRRTYRPYPNMNKQPATPRTSFIDHSKKPLMSGPPIFFSTHGLKPTIFGRQNRAIFAQSNRSFTASKAPQTRPFQSQISWRFWSNNLASYFGTHSRRGPVSSRSIRSKCSRRLGSSREPSLFYHRQGDAAGA